MRYGTAGAGAPGLALIALLAAPPAAAQETDSTAEAQPPAVERSAAASSDAKAVVEGFRGHPWGTSPSQIPEIADAQSGRAPNGMEAYGVSATLLGYDGTAFYLFDPLADELIEGIYVFPVELSDCQRAWDAFEAEIMEMHPTLRAERVRSEWEGEGRENGVYESFCEYFVFNPSTTNWITRLRNDETGLVEVGMAMRPQGLEPRLSVLYLSPGAARWEQERSRADSARVDSAGSEGADPPDLPPNGAGPKEEISE